MVDHWPKMLDGSYKLHTLIRDGKPISYLAKPFHASCFFLSCQVGDLFTGIGVFLQWVTRQTVAIAFNSTYKL